MLRDSNVFRYMMIFYAFAVLLRGIDILLMFPKSRRFYVILIESFKDSRPFLIIIIYICSALALANNLLEIGDKDKTMLLEAALIIFQDSLGGFSHPDEDEIKDVGLRFARWI